MDLSRFLKPQEKTEEVKVPELTEVSKFTKFNTSNRGFEHTYPLFLGEQLGVVDTINVNYPEFETLYEDQFAQQWNPFEIDLTQDRMDMLNLPKEKVDLMVKTILWQYAADSLATRSIIQTLGDFVTNPELEAWLMIQSFFEVIHAKSYSHIIKQTFQFPNEMLEDLYGDAEIMQRSEIIISTFDAIGKATWETPREELIKLILRAVVALFALEAIAFMSSFAVTFAITEDDIFAGIGQHVTLICRDEVLHAKGGYTLLRLMKQDPEFAKALEDNSFELELLLDEVVKQELRWADYLFSEGRQTGKLNAERLKEYTLFMALPVYQTVGCEFKFKKITESPLKYMDKYIDSSKMQVAAQELQLTSYQVNIIKDDSKDLVVEDLYKLFE